MKGAKILIVFPSDSDILSCAFSMNLSVLDNAIWLYMRYRKF